MALINVILSGGVGSRLWPLSRKSRPKQYIPLFDNSTLFQMCVRRNKDMADRILVVGNAGNYQLSRHDLEAEGVEDYSELIEAAPRNTAAAIAFAAFSVMPDDVLLVTPSDHIISGTEAYRAAIVKAAGLAEEGYLVTFGAIPTKPETGYGYIEHDAGYKVVSFKEKPSLATAEEYLAKGGYLWNSGMFCFKASTYLNELKAFAPEVYHASEVALQHSREGMLPLDETMAIPSISIDYAVMEHSSKIKVVPFDFAWSDLGSFESIWDYMDQGKPIEQQQKNLVLGSGKQVEFIGVENLVLVETDDAILIVPRNYTQDVKKVYERLEKEKPELLD